MYKGEDKEVLFTVTQDGSPLDLDLFTGILIYFYQGRNTVVAKYSLNTLADHGDITIIDASSGQMQVIIQRTQSDDFSSGMLRVEIKVSEVESSVDFSDSNFETIVQTTVEEVLDSLTKEVTGYD